MFATTTIFCDYWYFSHESSSKSLIHISFSLIYISSYVHTRKEPILLTVKKINLSSMTLSKKDFNMFFFMHNHLVHLSLNTHVCSFLGEKISRNLIIVCKTIFTYTHTCTSHHLTRSQITKWMKCCFERQIHACDSWKFDSWKDVEAVKMDECL